MTGKATPLAYGQIPLDEGEIVSKEPLDQGEPDKEDFEGYTGNAGMTLERWYHRAAVMIWPEKSRFDVLCEAGVEAAVGGLEKMVRQWKQAPQGERDALKQSCLDFAKGIIAHWPERKYASGVYSGYQFDDTGADDLEDEDNIEAEEDWDEDDDDENYDEPDDDDSDEVDAGQPEEAADKMAHPSLLPLLQELGDVPLIAAWIRSVLARDASVDPGSTLGDVCHRYGWETFQDDLRELFENTSNETLERHARLLADWSLRKDKNADRKRFASELADRLMAAIERWDPEPRPRDWQARTVNLRELLPLLTQGFLALQQPKLLDRLVTYVLDRPKAFDLTTVQVPALLDLQPWLKRNLKSPSPPLRRWLTAVAEELDGRASRPPQEPTDWRRESSTGCGCADCKELSRFLRDPNTPVLRLPLAEQRRRHLHHVIDSKKLDTTHVTERRGRPYTLVCTKTKASYERAVEAHHLDLDHRAKIHKLLDSLGGR